MGSPGDAIPTPREVLRAVFRHSRAMLFIFLALCLATVAIVIVWPRAYESEAKLLIRVGRESVTLDPTATTGETITLQKFQEEEVNSVLEMLNSRQVREAVVDTLGPDTILYGIADDGEASTKSSMFRDLVAAAKSTLGDAVDTVATGIGIKDPISDRERAVRQLEKTLGASAPKRSTVASIWCRAKSPELAQKIVAAATEAFLDQHVQMSRTEGSHEFFSEQASQLREQLQAAYAALRDRKNEYGLIDVDSRRSILRDEISNVELEALATDRELRFSETKIEELAAQLEKLPATIVGETVNVSNSARDGMRQQLYELESREQELLAKRTTNHPSVQKIQNQRREIQRILESQPADRENLTEIPNPIKKELEGEMLRERAHVEALHSRRDALDEQQETLRNELEQLNQQAVEMASLERKVELLEATYRAHVDKLEQARIEDALQVEQISSINVAQPATFVEKPISPKKRALLLVGFMFALLASAGYAAAAETLDTTLRTREQVQAELDLPVLATVPQSAGRSRRRGLARKAAQVSRNGSAQSPGEPAVAGIADSDAQPYYEVLACRLNGAPHSPSGPRSRAVRVGVVHCTDDVHDGTVATQLALQARHLRNEPVLLVDADASHRSVGEQFGVNGAPGLREILHGESDLGTCLLDAGVGNLSLLAAGSGGNRPLPVRDLSRIAQQLEPIAEHYGMVIVDLPGPTATGAEIAAAAQLDAVLLVVEAESTRIHSARRIKEQLSAAGANVLGVVLTGSRHYIPEWLYRRL